MTEFIRGIRMPLSTIVVPALARIVLNMAGYFPSRSRIGCLTRRLALSRSMGRFRVVWVSHAAVGWAVTPRMRTWRVACSMTARMWSLALVSVTVLKKSAGDEGVGLCAQERRRGGAGGLGCRFDTGLVEDLPYGRGGEGGTEDEKFAVDFSVASGVVLGGEARHQPADRSDGSWRPGLLGSGGPGVSLGDYVAVSAQRGLRTD